MTRTLFATAAAALVLAPTAAAHVSVVPAFLEDGQHTTLLFGAPNERPAHVVTEFTVTAPRGIELSRSDPPPGWTLRIDARKATWTGGRTAPDETGEFRLTATTESAPTAVTLVAVQRYDDGGTVRWTIPFTILPASHSPREHLWPAFIVGAVGVVVIVGGLVLARRRRRPSRVT